MNANIEATTIFMVDDDQDDCLIVKHAASRVSPGIHIRFFHSGMELLDYFDQALLGEIEMVVPQLLLLDLNMPRLGGKDVLATLKKHTSLHQIPIAIYTTSDSYAERAQCQALGAAAYVVKPNTLPEIESKLQWLCQSAAKR